MNHSIVLKTLSYLCGTNTLLLICTFLCMNEVQNEAIYEEF